MLMNLSLDYRGIARGSLKQSVAEYYFRDTQTPSLRPGAKQGEGQSGAGVAVSVSRFLVAARIREISAGHVKKEGLPMTKWSETRDVLAVGLDGQLLRRPALRR